MHEQSVKKIKLEPKSLATEPKGLSWKYLLFALVACALMIGVLVAARHTTNKDVNATLHSSVDLRILHLEFVRSSEAREQGLSGRDKLQKNQAMVFDFRDNADGRCFWMKDMNFSIDIIWLNDEHKVVKVVESASPDSYPESFCSTSKPTYVVELVAGQARVLQIREGKTVKL